MKKESENFKRENEEFRKKCVDFQKLKVTAFLLILLIIKKMKY